MSEPKPKDIDYPALLDRRKLQAQVAINLIKLLTGMRYGRIERVRDNDKQHRVIDYSNAAYIVEFDKAGKNYIWKELDPQHPKTFVYDDEANVIVDETTEE